MHDSNSAARVAPATGTVDDATRYARNRATILRFSEAWSRGDVDGLLALMSADPTYRGSSGPGPGTCFRGRDEVRAAFARMLTPQADAPPVPPPRMFLFENQALVYWTLKLRAADGSFSEVDGVDVLSFTDDGKIAMKDAYRKAFG